MTKRKTLLYHVARATMTLFLAVAGITNASAAAHWVGNSAIYVNGTWYYAGTEFDWCTGGAFDGANLGTFVNSIPLAGQSQNHEYGDMNWNDGSVTMYYKIDGGEQQSISLPWQSYNSDTHNNLFESKDEYGDFVITSVDISGLSAGSHTIEVYFYCDNAWDSNNSQNYKANFTVCDATKTVSYIDENGETQNVEANVLANGADVSSLSGWNVVEGTANFFSTLTFTADARLILADGTSLTINSSDCGIYSDYNFSMYSQSTGNNQGVINATGGYSTSIYVKDISIYGGVVHVYDSGYGIFTTGNISIYGGNIDASGESYGIDANYGNGTITIYGGSVKASSYGGTVKIASGLVYSDGTINNIKGTISDVSDIANKTLSLYGYSYIDDEGNGQIKTTSEVMVINSGNQPSSLGDYYNMDNDYWYVITGNDVVFDDEVDGYGNIHLILTDDANITFNTAIQVSGSLTIYGQGDDTGILNSASYGYGISVSDYFTINGGTINASSPNNSGISASSVTINGGTVTATGDDYGISTGGEIIINGGFIEAIGDYYGIYSSDGGITITGGTVTTTGGISTDSSSDITITGGKVTANGKEDGISSSGGNIIISGGDITAISTGNNEDRGGIWTFGGDIEITDGNVTATATGTNGNGLFSGQNVLFYGDEFGGSITISGGTVIANGNKSGIYAKAVEGNVCTITLSGGSVTAKASDENLANSYRGNVIIADDLIYSDGTNTYEGLLTLDNNQKAAIAGKGMHPVRKSYTLTAKKVNDDDDYYWTTFYCGDAGYSIEDSEAIEGDDAYAYTATYDSDNNNIVLHSLGTNIPEKTAVVIVSSSSSVSLSKADNLGKFSGSNDLRGVDVATAFDDLKTAYSADALLMLSNKNGNFGFHDVALTNVPARKAFLPIDDPDPNPVRSFNIVFEDDDTTGINAVNNEERICNDTWYDLQGRKIQMPTQRGLYIHNGKKIVVK